MPSSRRASVLSAVLALASASPAAAFPIGLGVDRAVDNVHVTDNHEEHAHTSFDFKQNVNTISLLDYSGILCAGFQNVHRQSEARNEAMDRASRDSSVKAGDTVTYSYKAAEVQAGSPCGVKLYYADGGDVNGTNVKLDGWAAFGGFQAPFENSPDLFWRAYLYADVRKMKGAGDSQNLVAMPFEYEVGKTLNINGVGGFFVSGMVGYEMVFWILKAMVGNEFPTSFLRYGATIGYQTPIESLQVRLQYKSTDEGFDEIGYKERSTSLGLFFQM